MLDKINERNELTERLIKTLEGLPSNEKVRIIAGWLSLDNLRLCVKFQESQNK